MSRYKDRQAITAALQAADPLSNVYDRPRILLDTSPDSYMQEYGQTVANGERYLNVWFFSRTGVPVSENDVGGGLQGFSSQWHDGTPIGNSNELLHEIETWQIKGYKTFIDSPTEGDPTEYAFQETIDLVKSQLRNTGAMRELMVTHEARVNSILVDEITQLPLAGEKVCHFVFISLTIEFQRQLA